MGCHGRYVAIYRTKQKLLKRRVRLKVFILRHYYFLSRDNYIFKQEKKVPHGWSKFSQVNHCVKVELGHDQYRV